MAKRPTRGKKARRKKTARRKPAARTKRRTARKRRWRRTLRVGVAVLFAGALALGAWLVVLDGEIRSRFEGQRWQVPARVYAQPLELYAGLAMGAAALEQRLVELGYGRTESAPGPGQFARAGRDLVLRTRPFVFWDGAQPSTAARIRFERRRIVSLADAAGAVLPILRLDPALIGSIVPGSGEDRLVLERASVPSLLPAALVAVEDQDFYSHHGVDLSAIARAAWVNLRAGGVRQGGSTLTQQLVKSYFLDNRRTFRRKAREALMAILLDARYDKDELMLGYINEVYMGQDGARAVHGFGLASRFYFGRPLAELETEQIALLVAVVRGPSLYDPRRRPERARERRDHVLGLLAARGVISAAAAERAKGRPLGVIETAGRVSGRFPAFMDLVRRQLQRDYPADALTSTGLSVFTTLDPAVQARAEALSATELARVEARYGVESGSLEVGAVVSDPRSGEIRALVGGRQPGFAGFNRALSARRPVGSLIKPVVFLTAIERAGFHLASPLLDAPLTLTDERGVDWSPGNYDEGFAGEVPLYRALTESINLPTVRAGLEAGPAQVAETLSRLGLNRREEAFPSLLLGAVDMTPLEVSEIYAAFASDGYRVAPRAVREVLDARGVALRRYGLDIERAASPEAVAQINAALVAVMRHGTGRSALLPDALTVAGKSGSTNDLRDAWFAGFSADTQVTVWVGRDDNQPMGLTGSRAALPVFSALMSEFAGQGFTPATPAGLEAMHLDYASGALSAPSCGATVLLPLPPDADLPVLPGCREAAQSHRPPGGIRKWISDRFGD